MMGWVLFPPIAVLVPAASFAFASSISPGPNNLMLTASGVNFGLLRTAPHMAGIATGGTAVLMLVGLGLAALFGIVPELRLGLRMAGAAATLWLAYNIAVSGSIGAATVRPHPMRFWAAFMFQAINPNVWIIAMGAVALFVRPAHALADLIFITVLLEVVNIPCMLAWTGFGAIIRDVLQPPGRLRTFNIVMGVALAATTLSLLRG